MNKFLETCPAKPFFLETDFGKRFCIYHSPNSKKKFCGAFLYIHPFGEELNKTRRMAALQARAFSHLGFGVLQVDLFGCGDSDGELSEARWDIWRQDIFFGIEWLKNHTASVSMNLWGLRLGALLALDCARYLNNNTKIQNILLWQPILNGYSFLTQFLRLQLANKLFSVDEQNTQNVRDLRNSLAAGKTLEVAGYELAPELTASIDHLKMGEMIVMSGNVHWFDIVADPAQSNNPAKSKTMDKWKKESDNLYIYSIAGLSFWATQEITDCPQLIAATTKLFAEQYNAL